MLKLSTSELENLVCLYKKEMVKLENKPPRKNMDSRSLNKKFAANYAKDKKFTTNYATIYDSNLNSLFSKLKKINDDKEPIDPNVRRQLYRHFDAEIGKNYELTESEHEGARRMFVEMCQAFYGEHLLAEGLRVKC